MSRPTKHRRRHRRFRPRLPPDDDVLVHCWMGVSRSPAAAYIIACARAPGEERAIAEELRRRSPTATPNRAARVAGRRLLSRNGRMVEAIDAIGRGARSRATPSRSPSRSPCASSPEGASTVLYMAATGRQPWPGRARPSFGHGRSAAQGEAHRRDPKLRLAGDAHRHHHRRRGRCRRRLFLHHRDRRLVGHAAAGRPSRAAPDRPRRRPHRGDLARTGVRDPRHHDRRDLRAGARRDRHRLMDLSEAAGLPLWIAAGGAADRRPLYTTEGGWLHCPPRRWWRTRWRRGRRVFAAPRSRSAAPMAARITRGSPRCARRSAPASRS